VKVSEEAIRSSLRRLTERVEPSEELWARIRPRTTSVRSLPKGRASASRTTIAVAAVVLLAVVSVRPWARDDATELLEATQGTTTSVEEPTLRTPGPVSPPGWRSVPAAPLSGRSSHTAVWTGTEMIVWGGVSAAGFAADGAAYNPSTGEWRRIATAPVDARSDHRAVWTGTEMIVWGGEGRGVPRPPGSSSLTNLRLDGAAYDPARDTWRLLPPAPVEQKRHAIAAVWTGAEMILWGASVASDGGTDVLAIAYDPDSNRWRMLSTAGQPARQDASVVWTGNEMIVWGGLSPTGESADGAAYNPGSDTWRPVPPAPIPGRALHTAVWVGTEMVVFGGAALRQVAGNEVAAFDPVANQWRRLADPPVRPLGRPAVAAGNRLIASSFADDATSGALYDRTSDVWSVRPRSPIPLWTGVSAVWTGLEMIVWGGERASGSIPPESDGAALVPPT